MNDFTPLAARLRPQTLDEFVGQQHLLAVGKPLRQALEQGQLHSMIFWGPPGTGKTTLAQLAAQSSQARFETLSAVLAGVKEIRAAVERAQQAQRQEQKATVLFVDEVHRFNKAQQDAFLPHIERGDILFIGATTENPSFELNNALLSRVRVYVLKPLTEADLKQVLTRACQNLSVEIPKSCQTFLIGIADGDARRLLNLIEQLVDLDQPITEELVQQVCAHGYRQFDKQGEHFYDQISALHKSIRGSNPDAALYWFCRMLDGGCDPLYVARRLVRLASEDIGNADPRALTLTLQAWDVYERLGSPEGELAIAQAVLYLAAAAKSNAAYLAYNQAMSEVKQRPSYPVPMHLRNSPTRLMKELGYSKGYRYAHDEPEAYAAGESYFPEEMEPLEFYQPVSRGLEIQIREKLERLKQRDSQS